MDLKSRLAVLKKSASIVKPPALHPARVPPAGWSRAAEHVWSRTIDIPFARVPEKFSPALMRPENRNLANGPTHARAGSEGDPRTERCNEVLSIDRLAFLDVETTGLSGGSGTVAFLATVARFEGKDLILSQTFLEDYPGEPDFLGIVRNQLLSVDWVVSYNGASFDVPLLQSRCIVNRIPPPMVRQIDILHDCRRFWSHRAESCTLGAMEGLLLSKQRQEDIPSAFVPRVWLDFVATEGPIADRNALLPLVWQHNLEDVISLVEIFLIVESAYREPREALARCSIDPSGLARSLLRLGRRDAAKQILLLVRDQPQDFDIGPRRRTKALLLLASIAKSERDFGMYRRTVLSMDEDSVVGSIAKAKLYEHVEKDAQAALKWARHAQDLAAAFGEEAKELAPPRLAALSKSIEHRVERLLKKVERKSTTCRSSHEGERD